MEMNAFFMAPSAQFVPQLMDEPFEWMKKSRNSVHPLIMSSVFHYEFVFIHPFADGKVTLRYQQNVA